MGESKLCYCKKQLGSLARRQSEELYNICKNFEEQRETPPLGSANVKAGWVPLRHGATWCCSDTDGDKFIVWRRLTKLLGWSPSQHWTNKSKWRMWRSFKLCARYTTTLVGPTTTTPNKNGIYQIGAERICKSYWVVFRIQPKLLKCVWEGAPCNAVHYTTTVSACRCSFVQKVLRTGDDINCAPPQLLPRGMQLRGGEGRDIILYSILMFQTHACGVWSQPARMHVWVCN